MLLLVTSCVVLCACVNGLAVEENKAAPSPLVYETFADAGRYLFDPTPQNWTDASKVCRAYNGHLAFPKTQDEANALWSIMTRYNVNQTHIGFHDQFVEGEYYTAKGRLLSETSFNKWSSGAPIGGSSLNCGGLRDDGLVDAACSDSHPSICEENDSTDNGGFLDYDYIQGHGFYKLYNNETTWPQALRTCYNDGAHLLILNSQEEDDAIFNKYEITNLFLGIHQFHYQGYFVTIFDDPIESTGYLRWAPDEPVGNYLMLPIVMIRRNGMFTFYATSSYHYICEYNPNIV